MSDSCQTSNQACAGERSAIATLRTLVLTRSRRCAGLTRSAAVNEPGLEIGTVKTRSRDALITLRCILAGAPDRTTTTGRHSRAHWPTSLQLWGTSSQVHVEFILDGRVESTGLPTGTPTPAMRCR